MGHPVYDCPEDHLVPPKHGGYMNRDFKKSVCSEVIDVVRDAYQVQDDTCIHYS